MTEAKKESTTRISKGRRVAKSIRRHLVNYIFIAIAGSILITCTSTIAKAYWVKRPLEKAPSYLAKNKIDELIKALDKTSRWESLYPALKPRRDSIAIRCYARKNELGKAMGIADAMVTASVSQPTFMDFVKGFIPPQTVKTLVDRFSYFVNQMEKPLAAMIDLKFHKQNIEMHIDGWSGYTCLTDELKAADNKEGLKTVLETCRQYHPDSPFTASLERFVAGIAGSGKKMPRPDEEAPVGWAVVAKERIGLYDKSGSLLTRATEGTIIEVDEIRDSKSGKIVMGSLKHRTSSQPGVVALAKDLTLKRGLLFELDDAVMNMLFTRAELTEKIAEAKESAAERASAANPYAAEYKKIADEYRELWKKIDVVTKKFKSTTGTEREKYSDELRTLKPKNIRLGNELKSAKAKYQEWIETHKQPATTSPEVADLRAQLSQVEAELRELGYL